MPDEASESCGAVIPGCSGTGLEPEIEVAVATLDPSTALLVERQGRLVSAVELVSPRNKDRPTAREAYLARYLGYLLESVHLLLVDVHRRPVGFSFAGSDRGRAVDRTGVAPAPSAVSYRVGEPAASGGSVPRHLAQRPRPGGQLAHDAAGPGCGLVTSSVNLERTYSAAAADAYVA